MLRIYEGPQMPCDHIYLEEKTWLPRLDNHIVVKHPFCNKCGFFKNITGDKGKRMGYYINALFKIKDYLEKKRISKLTKVQIRLVSKDLKQLDGFEDIYWTAKSVQNRMFIETLKTHTDLTESFIKTFI